MLYEVITDWVEEAHPVRTAHDAVATADAPLAVNQDHPVTGLVGGADRADLDTDRCGAVITEFGHEERLGDLLVGDQSFSGFVFVKKFV